MKLIRFNSVLSSILVGIVLLTSTPHRSEGFIFSRNEPLNNLSDLAQAQMGTLLNVRLQISNPKSLSQLYIDGISLELQCRAPHDGKDHVMLPGINGEQPELSTGPLGLKVTGGSFISSSGLQTLELEQEAWEMVWVAGVCLCFAFHVYELE